jgi:hypothetical protein
MCMEGDRAMYGKRGRQSMGIGKSDGDLFEIESESSLLN